MGRALFPPDRSRRSRAQFCPAATVLTGSPDFNSRYGRTSLHRLEGDDRARIPQPSSFRRVAGGGEQRRASAFAAGGDDVNRLIVSVRLGGDFAAIVGDCPIVSSNSPRRAATAGSKLPGLTGTLLLCLRRVKIVPPLGSQIGLPEVSLSKAIKPSTTV